MTKDYINLNAIKRFLDNLIERFAPIEHTHNESDILDLKGLVVTSDGQGNVTFSHSALSTMAVYNNESFSKLKEKVETIESILDDNEILVTSNTSN